MKNFDKTFIAEADKWKDEIDSALIKMLLLKENFKYREDFQKFSEIFKDRKKPIPVYFFIKYGLNYSGVSGLISSRSVSREEALSILDPENEVRTPTDKQKHFIVKLFHSYGIAQVEFDNSPIEYNYLIPFQYVNKYGLKPYQRLLMIDLRKKDQELKKEFESYLKHVYAKHKDAKDGEKRHSEFYVSWEPDTVLPANYD